MNKTGARSHKHTSALADPTPNGVEGNLAKGMRQLK